MEVYNFYRSALSYEPNQAFYEVEPSDCKVMCKLYIHWSTVQTNSVLSDSYSNSATNQTQGATLIPGSRVNGC